MPLKATTDSLLRLTRGPPLVGAVRVVLLVAAAFGERDFFVERCFVCCAMIPCFRWVHVECPVIHIFDSSTKYASDDFADHVLRDAFCLYKQCVDSIVLFLVGREKKALQVDSIDQGLSAACESLTLK